MNDFESDAKSDFQLNFQLDFQYAGQSQKTLQNVAGQIPHGRCVVLCGGSGCGKSTLLRCVNGLIPQFYEGELKGFCRLNGKDTADLSIGQIGELAASVFQDPRSQFFTVNSSSEVAFGLENHGLPQAQIRERVGEAFRVFHLEHLKDRSVYALSSGERQLVALLCAWAMDADVFLLDEPTANLDFAATRRLSDVLRALKRQGKTLLLSEHRLYYLNGIADEYWRMENGEIKAKYTADEMRAFSPQQLRALSLRTTDLSNIALCERPAESPAAPEALRADKLCFTYRKKTAPQISDLNFRVREREIVGLVGANGCGKTTIGKLVAGLYRPSGGQISLYGKAMTPKQLQSRVMFVMQEAEFQFFTDSVLHELQYGHALTPEFTAQAESLLHRMGMWACRDRHPFSLSGGQMQKLTLMTAFLSEKPIVVLDEPTAGQDAESLESCAALIRKMAETKTVLVITHDLELIAAVCDRCIAFSKSASKTELSELPLKSESDLSAVRRAMECFRPTESPPETRKRARFHPITKLAFFLATMAAVSAANNLLAFCVFGALVVLSMTDGGVAPALAGVGLLAALFAADALFPHTTISFLLVLLPRIAAVWISMELMIGLDEAGRTLAALRELHLPERFIMIVAVIFRFFPVLRGDMTLLRQSVATRGAFTTLREKLRALPEYLEILTVPMALRVIRIAETLSASAETRGIDLKRKKSNYLSLRFSALDAVFLVLLAVSIVVSLL